MKKMIKERKYIQSPACITEEQTLGDVLACVKRLIDEFGDDAAIGFVSGYNDISEEIFYWSEREETDAEYACRLKCENKKLEKDRKEYERLKKMFESE